MSCDNPAFKGILTTEGVHTVPVPGYIPGPYWWNESVVTDLEAYSASSTPIDHTSAVNIAQGEILGTSYHRHDVYLC